MNYVDIAVLVIIALFVFFGFINGFLKTLTSLAATLLALTAAFLFAKTLASIIGGIGGVKEALGGLVGGLFKGEIFSTQIDMTNEASVVAALTTLKIPEFLSKILAPAVVASVPAGAAGGASTIGEYLGPVIIDFILVIISFIVIFLVVRLIMRLVEKFIKGILLNKTLRAGDRIIGGVVGLVKAYLFLCIALIVFELLIPAIPALKSVEGMLVESNLAKTIIEKNIVKDIFTKLNLGEILKGLLG